MTIEVHEVQVDFDNGGRPWLRCVSHRPEGGLGEGEYVFRQLYHTQVEFERNFKVFIETHPPKDGMITDLDHRRRQMTWPDVKMYLNINS